MAGQSPVSPLAPKLPPTLPPVAGVRFAAHAAGIRYKVRSDVMVAAMEPGTTVGGVLTRSLTASAPVDSCRANLKTVYREQVGQQSHIGGIVVHHQNIACGASTGGERAFGVQTCRGSRHRRYGHCAPPRAM